MEAAIRAMGGNVNSRFGPNNQTMLHAVILDDENTDKQTSDLVEKLLEQGADPDIQGEDGGAPLLMAAAKGKVHVVRTLVRAKAKPWLKDKRGFTALHYAAMKPCNVAIIEAIAAHPAADIDVEASLPKRPAGGGSPLFIATVEGQVDAVRLLLRLGARTDIPCCGQLARAVAVEKGHHEIVRLLDQAPKLSPSARGGRRSGHNVLRLQTDVTEEGIAAMKVRVRVRVSPSPSPSPNPNPSPSPNPNPSPNPSPNQSPNLNPRAPEPPNPSPNPNPNPNPNQAGWVCSLL